MNNTLTRCPVCQNELIITRLHCDACDTSIEGRFVGGSFGNLAKEQLDFIEVFVRCEGKLNRMADEMRISYPTLRNRLHEIIRAMGYEPGKDEGNDISEERRHQILEDLEHGKISPGDATRLLRGEEE